MAGPVGSDGRSRSHVTEARSEAGTSGPAIPLVTVTASRHRQHSIMREIVHIQAGQCGNQIGAKVSLSFKFVSHIWNMINEPQQLLIAINNPFLEELKCPTLFQLLMLFIP